MWHVWLALFVAFAGAGCPSRADPEKSFTRLQIAYDYLKKGEYDRSEKETLKALEYDAKNVQAHHNLGYLDLLRARRNFRLLEIEDCLSGIDAEALRLEMDQQLAAADAHFTQGVKIDPNYGESWHFRGVVATRRKRIKDAVRYFSKALEFPSRVEDLGLLRANLGWAYYQDGNALQALKELKQSFQFEPGKCVTNYRLGRVYFDRKEWDKSLQHFDVVLTTKGCTIQEAHYYAMLANEKLGNMEKREQLRQSCIQLGKRSCVAAKCDSGVWP